MDSPNTVAAPRRILPGFPLQPTLTGAILSSGRSLDCEAAMTINLTRIYTRLGDGGETHLGDMSRVPKTDPRIEAYGTIDELNSQLGLTLTVDGLDDQHADWIRHVQNDLFDVGADIAAPEDPEHERLRV